MFDLGDTDRDLKRMEAYQELAGNVFFAYNDTEVRKEIEKKLKGEEMRPADREDLYSVKVPKKAKIKIYRYGNPWVYGMERPAIVVVNYPEKQLKYAIVVDFISKQRKYYKFPISKL